MADEDEPDTPDPIDVEAAHIDARADDIGDEIEALKEDAEELGRDVED